MTETRRLKILFLSSWYPSKAHTTLGNFVQRHAEAVALLHQVIVLYITPSEDASQASLLEEEESRGVTAVRVYYKAGPLSVYRAWKAFQKGLEHLFGKQRPDIDLMHMNVLWNAGWQAQYLHHRYHIPFVVTEHWTGFNRAARKDVANWKIKLSSLFARNASFVCPVSTELKEHMIKAGARGPFAIVPNAVDLSIFRASQPNEGKLRFLHVSSLDNAHKNIEGILRVWKRLSDQYQHIELNIGGDGPYLQWSQRAKEMGIQKQSINFFGEKSWEEIAECMHQSDVFMLFSNYENLPCVILESLASGMPVIATKVGGIREVINETRGILVEAKNEDELATAISVMVNNSGKFNRYEISSYAKNEFSFEAVAAKFDEVYRKALKNHEA